MTVQTKRIYKGKDAEMLTATATIISHALENKVFLIGKRATWADPFFPDIQTRINSAFQNFLGVDNAQQMRQATLLVLSLQQNALPKLAEFKVQVKEDFKGTALQEILTTLGFTAHHKAAQRKDQEALIELLFKFKTNMTPTLKTEITTKGTAATLIDEIIAFADQIKNSNISQETLKGGRKQISAAAVNEFNGIYSDVMTVAKISAKFLKDDKEKAELFSYTKTIKALNAPPKPNSDQP